MRVADHESQPVVSTHASWWTLQEEFTACRIKNLEHEGCAVHGDITQKDTERVQATRADVPEPNMATEYIHRKESIESLAAV